MMELTLEDLRVYARCPLEWFWEKRAGVQKPRMIADLAPEALRAALALYYASHADSLGQATGLVWRDWCEAWGEPAIAADLSRYARERAAILKGITRPDGSQYSAPQMTAAYRDHMHDSGLTHLGRRLDDFARSRGLLLADITDRVGSAFGDTYADCLLAAERVSHHRELPLPAREVVLGWQVPYQVELGTGTRLTGVAALASHGISEARESVVTVEVHEYDERQPGRRASWAGRDIRVIAASLAQPTTDSRDSAGRPLTWERVDRVVYRHWPSGEAFTFREANVGHLLAVVATAARGMSGQIVIPRALTGYDDCRPCAYRVRCWEEGWETLHLVDAGMLGRAEQLRDLVRQVREAIGEDSQAARGALRAVEIIQKMLGHSPMDDVATLNEVRHRLEVMLEE